MYTSSVTVVVARPVEEVFAFVEDARNRPSSDESVDSEELTSPDPIRVGTTVRTTMRSMGRDLRYTWTVTAHQPPTAMTIESTSGPFDTVLTYRLTPEGGGTRLQFSVIGRPSGLNRLIERLIARTTQRNLNRAFVRLRRLLETGSAV